MTIARLGYIYKQLIQECANIIYYVCVYTCIVSLIQMCNKTTVINVLVMTVNMYGLT